MPFDATPQETELVRDLRAARAYLVEHGWCQERTHIGGRSCALGAAMMVTGALNAYNTEPVNRYARAHIALRRILPEFSSVAFWNDLPERTLDEVLALYDRAIEDALRG